MHCVHTGHFQRLPPVPGPTFARERSHGHPETRLHADIVIAHLLADICVEKRAGRNRSVQKRNHRRLMTYAVARCVLWRAGGLVPMRATHDGPLSCVHQNRNAAVPRRAELGRAIAA